MKLTITGTLFGIELASNVQEIWLGKGRVFRNPVATGGNWDLSIGPNITLYKEINGQRRIDRDVAKYLLDIEIDSPSGKLRGNTWGVSISGSGGVTVGGNVGLSVFKGSVREELERVILPLRLGTKARIMMFPIMVQGGDRNTVSQKGYDQPIMVPFGSYIIAELMQEDCDSLVKLANRISTISLTEYQVPTEIFRDSFYKEDASERGLNLFTCLESLFSQGPESIRFKLAYRTSCILDFGSENMHNTCTFIKDGYKHRSNIVHGKPRERDKARQWFESNVLELEDIVRRTLFTILELRRAGTNLIGEDNIDKYIFKNLLTGKSTGFQKKIICVGKLSFLQIGF